MKASVVDRRAPAAACAAVLIVSAGLLSGLDAQLRVQPLAGRSGEVARRLLDRQLTTIGTFMQTSAHPDDEDNVLLAALGHGRGMQTVVVSATRGEGGQNEIGPELSDALSVLRTEELLAAHRFDGAEQFFTRALDFGFSFSTEETIDKWGRAEIVGDFVRHIRAVRPHVIAAFVCRGEGGGQAHQASTALTIEAVRDAADPSKYPEQVREGLRPWRALRLFCTQGFGRSDPSPGLLAVAGREFDPVIGRTFAELGAEARSMHKCQGMSQLLPLPGSAIARYYELLKDHAPGPQPLRDMFDGIDTSIPGLAAYAGGDASIRGALVHIDGAAASADYPAGLRLIRQLRGRLQADGLDDQGRYEIDFRLARKERQFEHALVLNRRLRVEAVADDGVITTGQPLSVTTVVENGGASSVELHRVALAGVAIQPQACAGTVDAGKSRDCRAETRVAAAEPTGIYWSARGDAARYEFAPHRPFGAPFAPSPFRATFELSVDGQRVTIDRPIEHRYGDVVAGEKRMELHVVPAFALDLSPSIAILPRGSGARLQRRIVRVEVTNTGKTRGTGTLRLRVPEGWTVVPEEAPLEFAREDEAATVAFNVEAPPGVRAGEYPIAAAFAAGAQSSVFDRGFQVIEYPHVHRRHIVRPAVGTLRVVDVRIAERLRVGYVMGVGDRVPEAIEQLGAAVEMIGPEELSGDNLEGYDAIVIGVRAYERRPDLRANNHRLLRYAERGGTVLVQYNKFEFNEAQYGPYPAKVSADRVTDEHAPVEVLVPSHPVFNQPNRIDAAAWAGWVQERGLYFLGERDPRYLDLVRLRDPFPLNAGPKTGALVEARVGQGRWIYVGLGLWRQLPAGTDGAYRLLANLLSLGRSGAK